MITFKGSPLTLQGPPLRVGDTMPGFTLTDTALTEVRDTDLCGIRVFLTVPSLDTDVCDQEVRWFTEKAAELPGVTIVAVSLDLPFAQAAGAAGAASRPSNPVRLQGAAVLERRPAPISRSSPSSPARSSWWTKTIRWYTPRWCRR